MDPALVCSDCNQRFKASVGHCRGGKYSGCCSSFGTVATAEAHRVGAFDDGTRRCLTVAERADLGWYQTTDGFWRRPADDVAAEKLRQRFHDADA